MRYAMIMAGGAGTRLWPMSRKDRPKQLLPLIGGRSLLEIAASRLEGLVPSDRRLICTGEPFRGVIRASMPEFGDQQILGEPVGRDTVNAVGFTAAVLAKRDPDAVFAVLTADHLIEPADEFQRKLDEGYKLVEENPNRFVTFGITPTRPDTGYGYVERGAAIQGYDDAFEVKRFVEKPDEKTARSFLEAGTFAWNSGMFVFHAQTVVDALAQLLPESHAGLLRIQAAWGTADQQRVLNDVYPHLPKISIDYALMEPASHSGSNQKVCMVSMNVQWTDVGSWTSYGETLPRDDHGNRATGQAVHLDSREVLVVTDDPEHTIATIGCEGLIVVHTQGATLVCRADQAQHVKEIAAMVNEGLR